MRMEHHDVRDTLGPNALAAVRAYRRLHAKHAQWFRDMEQAYEADRAFDCGEFGGGSGVADDVIDYEMSLMLHVAPRFGMLPHVLDYALHLAAECEHDAMVDASFVCPYHERGLDCRNSAPAGIDADGEPYGDNGCGCKHR